MSSFPVDNETLNVIYDSLSTSFSLDEEGNHVANGDFTLNDVLDMLSGFDPEKLERQEDLGEVECYYYPDPIYTSSDVIRALIDEIRRLRNDPDS